MNGRLSERLPDFTRRGAEDRADWTWLIVAAVLLGGSVMFAVAATATGQSSQRVAGQAAIASSQSAAAPRFTAPVLPPGTRVLRWEDLTLMVRTGLRDEEILAETAGLPLARRIGSLEENLLRGLGAGSRLVSALRARPVYSLPGAAEAERVVVTAPPVYQNAPPVYQSAPPVYRPSAPIASPPPPVYSAPTVDYAARDRRVADLKRQMEELDERIRLIRSNPQRYYYWYGSYGSDRQQAMDHYLDKLDKDRNDLRREKWALEGR